MTLTILSITNRVVIVCLYFFTPYVIYDLWWMCVNTISYDTHTVHVDEYMLLDFVLIWQHWPDGVVVHRGYAFDICSCFLYFALVCSQMCNVPGWSYITYPGSKVYGANMGPTWGRQNPDGPHVGPMNSVIRVYRMWFSWCQILITYVLDITLIWHCIYWVVSPFFDD